jgi:hypothetical protein
LRNDGVLSPVSRTQWSHFYPHITLIKVALALFVLGIIQGGDKVIPGGLDPGIGLNLRMGGENHGPGVILDFGWGILDGVILAVQILANE